MFSRNRYVALIPIMVLALAMMACSINIDGVGFHPYTAEETVSQSFETTGTPRVTVETFNGKIEVSTGAANSVQADVTKRGAGDTQAAAQQDLQNIDVQMVQQSGTIRITARRTDQPRKVGNTGATVNLRVPAGAILELHTSNGGITVNAQAGDVTINTSNGKVQVTGSSGRVKVDTSNGAIEISSNNALVDVHTSNGAITFKGTLAQGNHSFRTSNGAITLGLPSNAAFRLDASTSNGRISTDYAFQQTGGDGKTQLAGQVGNDPAVVIVAHTSNGSIQVQKAR